MLFFGIMLIVLSVIVWQIRWTKVRPLSGRIDTYRVTPFYRVLVALTALPAGVTMIVSHFS